MDARKFRKKSTIKCVHKVVNKVNKDGWKKGENLTLPFCRLPVSSETKA